PLHRGRALLPGLVPRSLNSGPAGASGAGLKGPCGGPRSSRAGGDTQKIIFSIRNVFYRLSAKPVVYRGRGPSTTIEAPSSRSIAEYGKPRCFPSPRKAFLPPG